MWFSGSFFIGFLHRLRRVMLRHIRIRGVFELRFKGAAASIAKCKYPETCGSAAWVSLFDVSTCNTSYRREGRVVR